jgi:hypothetical protein
LQYLKEFKTKEKDPCAYQSTKEGYFTFAALQQHFFLMSIPMIVATTEPTTPSTISSILVLLRPSSSEASLGCTLPAGQVLPVGQGTWFVIPSLGQKLPSGHRTGFGKPGAGQ